MVYLTVTHPSINRAWRRVTSLIVTNALPLSQTTNNAAVTLYVLLLQTYARHSPPSWPPSVNGWQGGRKWWLRGWFCCLYSDKLQLSQAHPVGQGGLLDDETAAGQFVDICQHRSFDNGWQYVSCGQWQLPLSGAPVKKMAINYHEGKTDPFRFRVWWNSSSLRDLFVRPYRQ